MTFFYSQANPHSRKKAPTLEKDLYLSSSRDSGISHAHCVQLSPVFPTLNWFPEGGIFLPWAVNQGENYEQLRLQGEKNSVYSWRDFFFPQFAKIKKYVLSTLYFHLNPAKNQVLTHWTLTDEQWSYSRGGNIIDTEGAAINLYWWRESGTQSVWPLVFTWLQFGP